MKNLETAEHLADLIAHAIKGDYYENREIRDILRHAIRRTSDGLNNWHANNEYRTKQVVKELKKAKKDVFSSDSKYHKYCSQNFRHEHIVPAIVIYEYIRYNELDSKEAVVEVLQRFCKTATISREEDDMLNKNKLATKMPVEFFDKTSDLYENPFARYIVAGIIEKKEDLMPGFKL